MIMIEMNQIVRSSDLMIMQCGAKIRSEYLAEVVNLTLGDRDGENGFTGAIQKHLNITRAKQLLRS